MIYVYKSPIGTFQIIPRNDRFLLAFEGEVYGSYNSAVAAADDVYTQHTGCMEWDDLEITNAPTDITEWSVYR